VWATGSMQVASAREQPLAIWEMKPISDCISCHMGYAYVVTSYLVAQRFHSINVRRIILHRRECSKGEVTCTPARRDERHLHAPRHCRAEMGS